MSVLNMLHSLHIDYLISLSVAVASGHIWEQDQRHSGSETTSLLRTAYSQESPSHSMTVVPSVHHPSATRYLLKHDSIRVYLCPSSSHYPGASARIGCGMPQHRYLVVLNIECHHWEEVLADLWGSEVVSDPGVSGPVLICVQTLPLPTARLDSQCAGNDWGHSWEVVRPGGGVYART